MLKLKFFFSSEVFYLFNLNVITFTKKKKKKEAKKALVKFSLNINDMTQSKPRSQAGFAYLLKVVKLKV